MPLELHYHPSPACQGGAHNRDCTGRGQEDTCSELKGELAGHCVCTHYVPDLRADDRLLTELPPIRIRLPHERSGQAQRGGAV
ncbi:MAG TPA: hypothetical protein PKE47_11280 [Verrucomicrobiota bacterium]|nr:hypothetical protein [Verrucomicrobiota bacterium]